MRLPAVFTSSLLNGRQDNKNKSGEGKLRSLKKFERTNRISCKIDQDFVSSKILVKKEEIFYVFNIKLLQKENKKVTVQCVHAFGVYVCKKSLFYECYPIV